MIRAELEGIDAVQRAFDRFPDEMIRELRRSLRNNLRPLQDRIKALAPKPEWAGLVTSKVSNRSGRVSGVVGYFGNRANGMEWYKTYWLNYGTLEGRDPDHRFESRVKSGTNPKQRHGIDYQHFFERATEGQDTAIMERVEKDLEDFVNKTHND